MTTDLYVREDWHLFRTLPTIARKSGVPPERLRRLVAKELADNALDCCGRCQVGTLGRGGFFIEEDGPGVPGDPDAIAWLFSVKRPLASSKLIRKPTRGALGNGLRVVAGAVLASGGTLDVFTCGRHLRLVPQYTGETSVTWEPCERQAGTRVEVCLGDSVPPDADFLEWANLAIAGAGDVPQGGEAPAGPSKLPTRLPAGWRVARTDRKSAR